MTQNNVNTGRIVTDAEELEVLKSIVKAHDHLAVKLLTAEPFDDGKYFRVYLAMEGLNAFNTLYLLGKAVSHREQLEISFT